MTSPQVYVGGWLTITGIIVRPMMLNGYIWLNDSFFKRKKPKYPGAVIHHGRGCENRGWVLDAVKFPESHEVIIMPMGPDYGIDMRGSVPEQLLAEVRGGVHQEMKTFVLDEE